MSSLCSNCEFAEASLLCSTCAAEEGNLFCASCGEIHLKVKKFRDHRLEKYEVAAKVLICCNCDEVVAKFRCMDCIDGDNLFCTGCSLLHPKVKATRNHRLVTAEYSEDLSTRVSVGKIDIFRAVKDVLSFMSNMDVVGSFDELPPNTKNYAGVGVIIVVFVIFFTIRQLVGRDGASVLTLLVGIFLMRWMQMKKAGGGPAPSVPRSLTQSSRSARNTTQRGKMCDNGISLHSINPKRFEFNAARFSDDEDGEFKDEFSYRRHSSAAKLRLRSGRKYQPRRARGMSGSDSGSSPTSPINTGNTVLPSIDDFNGAESSRIQVAARGTGRVTFQEVAEEWDEDE
jgi:hypothetical protein